MTGLPEREGDQICLHCGTRYEYDQGRRCWRCDRMACEHCSSPDSEPLCPECLASQLPEHIEPMLAILGDMPREQDKWGFEFKWDGIRSICYWDGRKHRMESRNLLDITARYPEFADIGAALDGPAVLDGEIVALAANGRPDFGRLQQRMHLSGKRIEQTAFRIPVSYFIFDILYLNGASVMHLPYSERRAMLQSTRLAHGAVKLSPSHDGEGDSMLDAAREWGLEGIMAKRLDSPYEPGKRSRGWIKLKIVQSQEFVVAGWTRERNNPSRIGSLLLGYYNGNGVLNYAGSVGSGFSDQDHASLLQELHRLRTSVNPFGSDLPRKGAFLVEPRMVVEVEYRRWPEGHFVQQASFKGVRPDKPAWQVAREKKET